MLIHMCFLQQSNMIHLLNSHMISWCDGSGNSLPAVSTCPVHMWCNVCFNFVQWWLPYRKKKWLRSDCGTNRLYPHIQWKPYINLIKYTKFKLCLNFSTDVIVLVTELLSHQQMFPEFHHQTSGIIVCSSWGAVGPTLTSLPPGCALLPPWTSLPQAASSWLLQFCRVWVWRRVSCCQRVRGHGHSPGDLQLPCSYLFGFILMPS